MDGRPWTSMYDQVFIICVQLIDTEFRTKCNIFLLMLNPLYNYLIITSETPRVTWFV